MLFVWIVVLLTHFRFRAALSPRAGRGAADPVAGADAAASFGVVALVAIAVTTAFVDGLRYTVPSFLLFLAVITLLYLSGVRRPANTDLP